MESLIEMMELDVIDFAKLVKNQKATHPSKVEESSSTLTQHAKEISFVQIKIVDGWSCEEF